MSKPKLAAHWQILGSLVLAAFTAIGLRMMFGGPETGAADSGFLATVIESCRFVGDLFMRALKMLIVPLIVSSVIAGIAGLHGIEGFARLGGKTVAFYLCSSLIAILVGLTLVNLIQPGLIDGQPSELIANAFAENSETADAADKSAVDQAASRETRELWDIFKRMLPPNIFAAATDNGQLLGLIVFSILFGIAITRLPLGEIETLRQVFQSLNDVMIVLTRWVMATAPIGIYALIIPIVYETGGELFQQLTKYFFTVLAALALHMFVVMPLVLRFIGRVNPADQFRAMRTALLTAFSTASSSATLPITMRCVQDNAGVSKRTASFTLPLGATVNMDGTALYECVAVIFVAQVMGMQLGFGEQFIIVLAALLTSVGVAGVPRASMVAILLILRNSGIPGAEAAVVTLFAVDPLLDMSRTAVNVFSDSCAAVVIAKSEGEKVLTKERGL